MTTYLHLSSLVEALVATNLTPAHSGQYCSTDRRHESTDNAIVLAVDHGFRHAAFTIDEALS